MKPFLYLLTLTLVGCSNGNGSVPVKAYRSLWAQVQAQAPLRILGLPCRSGGFPVPAEECFRFEKPRRWSGVIWQNDYFENRFVSGATGPRHPAGVRETGVLTSVQKPDCRGAFCRPIHHSNGPNDPEPELKAFKVTFVGRRTAYPGRYGHAGHFEHLIIADRMIAEQELPSN